jgi:hypothetical protein
MTCYVVEFMSPKEHMHNNHGMLIFLAMGTSRSNVLQGGKTMQWEEARWGGVQWRLMWDGQVRGRRDGAVRECESNGPCPYGAVRECESNGPCPSMC